MPHRKGNPEQPFSAWYKNYRGEINWRIILPIEIFYGSTEYHPAEQWFLKAYDPQKDAQRDFALSDFLGDCMREDLEGLTVEDRFKAISAGAQRLGYTLASEEEMEALTASLTVGYGLRVYGSIEALARVQNYILMNSNHPVEKADTRKSLARELARTEALLAAANDKIAELTALLAKKETA